MWIERIELNGFGKLTDTVVEFARDRLNVVIENNEFGKSTLAEAIWAVLFDFPPGRAAQGRLKEREARRPVAGRPYKACLDVVVKDGRKLRIVRDFSERILRVFDRGAGDIEVTEEFVSGPNGDELGLILTGMTRDLFRNTVFVGQRDLESHELEGDRNLASRLQSIADSSGSATTSATAIGVLEDALAHFPYAGKKQRLDRLVKELDERRHELAVRLQRLEEERLSVRAELKRLAAIDCELDGLDEKVQSAEYFHLCLQAAEIDSRLMRGQERLIRVGDLKRQLGELAQFAGFPIERQKKVEELWTTRQSRVSDLSRVKSELEDKERGAAARDMELRERWEGLTGFTVDDAQVLASTARTLQNVAAEYKEAKSKIESERKKVAEDGIDLENLGGVRKSLLNLDARDLDDAYAYNAMINSAREQIGTCERSVWRARMELAQAEEKRQLLKASRKNLVIALGLLTMLTSIVVALVLLGLRQRPGDPMAVIGFICLSVVLGAFVFACVLLVQSGSAFAREIEQAREEERKQASEGQELHSKVMGLEIRIEDLARKAGVVNGAELIKHIQAYATAAARLKDLDLLEQVVGSREQHIAKLTSELEDYFEKAGRKGVEVTPENATRLSEEINQYLEERRSLDAVAGVIENRTSEHAFLKDQIRDLDNELKEHFLQSKVNDLDDVEAGYEQFCRAAASFRQWEAARKELDRMETDTTSDLLPDDLPELIAELSKKRDAVWDRVEELVARNPNIADLPPPEVDPKAPTFAKDIAEMKDRLEALRREREELTVHVRASTKSYDEHYVGVVEEKEEVERQLENARGAKAALELACEMFGKISDETHSHWSSKLNEITREMLSAINSDYESLHFDADFAITARRKGMSEPLQPAQIRDQLSVGTREQINWLARVAVARFLSSQEPLPIILDEPFSESDDERFRSIMEFIIKTLAREHQIIMFTCHQARHRWLDSVLAPELSELVNRPSLQPLVRTT